MTKTCTKCNIDKELSEFCKNKSKPLGIETQCKECARIRSKLYRENPSNIEKIRETKKRCVANKPDHYKKQSVIRYERDKLKILTSQKSYYNDNKDVILDKQKRYYEINKSAINTRNKNWAKSNRGCVNKINKKWKLSNPDKVREQDRKRRARKLAVNENYTRLDEKYTKALFDNKCANCCSVTDLQIDHHYPLSKGNPLTRKNAVLLCKTCNASKWVKLPEQFYSKDKLNRIESLLNITP
jgi:5-methylcytosine-specific restriction endonuclease McrA